MASDLMIDIEALDTTPNCVILTIGLVTFNPYTDEIYERLTLRPTIDDQTTEYNRSISEDTLRWWSEQSPEALEEAMGDNDRMSLRDCMEVLYKFGWNRRAVWSHGAPYDIVVCESAMRQTLTDRPNPIPWPFYTVRDTRTLFEVANVSLKDDGFKTSHRAVDDAERQAVIVQKAYRKLNLIK